MHDPPFDAVIDAPFGKVGIRADATSVREIGSVPRAVGQACGANPLPIVIPCHRVVASGGIGGFAHHPGEGFYRNVKRWLLAHEGVSIA